MDTQRATVRQLEAAVVSDKAAEGTARLNLAYTRIVAPIEGRIGLRNVDVGNQVSTGDANGIVTITKLSPIDVEFAIPQDHASWLQHNAGAFMEVKAFDRTRTTLLDSGVFASLDNQIDTQTGTVRAKARFLREQKVPAGAIWYEDWVGLEHGPLPNLTHLPWGRWIVDPIDGTKSFINGVPLFGTGRASSHLRVAGISVRPSAGCSTRGR